MDSSSHRNNDSRPKFSFSGWQQAFVAEPNRRDPRAKAWEQQILLSADSPGTHASFGPLHASLRDPESVQTEFPGHVVCAPRVFTEGPHAMDFMAQLDRVFCASLLVGNEAYLNWLNRVESKKGEAWKRQGIFDLIQLSQHGPVYLSPMILAALHFWEYSSNGLHLKCGMITPTLLDVAAITGLKPTGLTFDPHAPTGHCTLDPLRTNFAGFIEDFHDTDNVDVSADEHITFLTLWLCSFVFCSSPRIVDESYMRLAVQLHEECPVKLSKLLLGSFYRSLALGSFGLKGSKPQGGYSVIGPIWLIQLWFLCRLSIFLGLCRRLKGGVPTSSGSSSEIPPRRERRGIQQLVFLLNFH